jgi:hypothetical protein
MSSQESDEDKDASKFGKMDRNSETYITENNMSDVAIGAQDEMEAEVEVPIARRSSEPSNLGDSSQVSDKQLEEAEEMAKKRFNSFLSRQIEIELGARRQKEELIQMDPDAWLEYLQNCTLLANDTMRRMKSTPENTPSSLKDSCRTDLPGLKRDKQTGR